jgi:hypothetical protein
VPQLRAHQRREQRWENRGAGDGWRRGNAFLQTDRRVSSSWNAYADASNNAVMKTDPLGLEDEDSCPPGSPICQSDETPVMEGGAGGGSSGHVVDPLMHRPSFWGLMSPRPIAPWGPHPGGGLECPPAKDCRMEPDRAACVECCI